MCSGWLRSTVRSGPSRKATTSPYSRLSRHTKPSISWAKASRWAPGTRGRGPGGNGVAIIHPPVVAVWHLVRVGVTTVWELRPCVRPERAAAGRQNARSPRRKLEETGEIAIGGAGDRRPGVIADLHGKAARSTLRNPAPDSTEPEQPQALTRNGRGLDPPVLLPAPDTDEAIGLKQVPRDGQQQHRRVGNRRGVRVGAMGDH